MKKPMIALMPLYDDEKNSYWMLPQYMKMIEQAGGLPVMLPMSDDHIILRQIAETFDGFLFIGGHDISPHLYHQEAMIQCGQICSCRDDMEKELFHLVYQMNKPMLGICRGIQLFNVLLGGTLYQDLPSQRKSLINHHQLPPYDKPQHNNTIIKGTPLYDLLAVEKLQVNSYHHQAIQELSPLLKEMAFSEDGLIEVIYQPDKKYLWAIQWHPEYMMHDQSSQLIIAEFIKKCC